MRIMVAGLILIILVVTHIFALGKADNAWKRLPQSESEDFILPAAVLKISSLEFKGLASDFLFLKAIVYIGGFASKKTLREISEEQWNRVYRILNMSSDLDPYFVDPYYIGNAFLTWDAGMTKKANQLLEKGIEARIWDWSLPFFAGFNYFFFLSENEKASEHLMEAYRRNPDPTLASLASRLAYKAKRTENAISFLEELYAKAEDTSLKKKYELRLSSLRNIHVLELAASSYEKKFGRRPRNIKELIRPRILSAIPQDPYGGVYFFSEDGLIRSTTSSELEPYNPPLRQR